MYIYKKLLLFIAFFILISNLSANQNLIDEYITNAETYYWLAIDEQGNLKSFDEAKVYLEKAKLKLNNGTDIPRKNNYISTIESLENDIFYQRDVHHDTFYGIFPLARLLQSNIFLDATTLKNYELVDDPTVIAVCNATNDFVSYFKRKIHVDVVFNSIPTNSALENESRYIFNEYPKFYVHSSGEIAYILNNKELQNFKDNNVTTKIINKLFSAFDPTNLLVVTIINKNAVNNNYWYILKGKLFDGPSLQSTTSLKSRGFCRDKRSIANDIFLLNFLLLLFSFVIFKVSNKISDIDINKFKFDNIILIFISFLFGRFFPWIAVPLLNSIKPLAENLMILSFWWLALFGIIIYLGSMFLFWLISQRVKKFLNFMALEGKLVQTFIVISMGISVYISELYLIYSSNPIISIVFIIIASASLALLVGKSLSRSLPYSHLVISLVLSAILGIICLTSNLQTIIVGTSIIVFITIVTIITFEIYCKKKKNLKDRVEESEQKEIKKENIPTNTAELAKKAEYPKYQQLEYFSKLKYFINDVRNNNYSVLGLVAPSGRGKTATAKEVISIIEECENRRVSILKGKCPDQKNDKSIIYSPFKEALGNYFRIDIFASAEENVANIDNMLEGVIGDFVPFTGLLFPDEKSIGSASSKKEMKLSVYKTIMKLAKKNMIVIYFDDLQWIDEGSGELLSFVLDRLKIKKAQNIGFIFTSQEENVLTEFGIEQEQIIKIPKLRHEDKVNILINSLGFEPTFASDLCDHIGQGVDREGELFYLLNTISYLARENVFQKEKTGFVLSQDYKSFKELPVPENYRESLKKKLDEIPDHYRHILESAACIGMEFNANILAESLEINRLKLLRDLEKIENETGLIYDIRESDDNYSFHSSFALKMLRENFIINHKGPKNNEVPQIVREYHARVAKTLEKTLEESSNFLYDVGKHYYAAGSKYAKEAMNYCVKGAYSASKNFRHEKAMQFLDMAKECAEIIGKEKELEEDYLIIHCNESHIEGTVDDLVVSVKLCKEFMNSHEELSDKIFPIITRTYFDAAKVLEEQDYFKKTVELGKKMIEIGDECLKAEGHQFVALGLNPKENREEIIVNLEKAIELLKPNSDDNKHARKLLARVYDSLATNLSYSDSEKDKRRAEVLYKNSVDIKKKSGVYDMPGSARSYGGLGRLMLEFNEPDIKQAKKYFQKDLDISKQIGDKKGLSQIYSHLGECASLEGNFDEAINYYERSYKESGKNVLNKIFAIHGYLINSAKLDSSVQVDKYGNLLIKILKNNSEKFKETILFLFKDFCNLPEIDKYKKEMWYYQLVKIIKNI